MRWLLLLTACDHDPPGGGWDTFRRETSDTGAASVFFGQDALDLGDVQVGCRKSKLLEVNVRLPAPHPLEAVRMVGPSADAFAVVTKPPDVEDRARSYEVLVTFSPVSVGPAEAEVEIVHQRSEPARLPVIGVGIDGRSFPITTTQGPLRPAVDLLVVVDPGATFDDERSALQDAAARLFAAFDALAVDARVGVISAAFDPGGRHGELVAPPIAVTSPSRVADLVAAIAGIGEPTASRPLAALNAALTAPLITSVNASLRRDGTPLAAVVLSDRDDASDLPTDAWRTWADATLPTLVVATGPRAQGCDGIDPTAAAAPRLHDVSARAGDAWLELCRFDAGRVWSDTAAAAAGQILQIAVPNDTIRVRVEQGGVELPEDPTNGWTFDGGDRVTLHGDARPSLAEVVDVIATRTGCAEEGP